MNEEKKELSFGERLVGLRFNPSENPDVKTVKTSAAAFADTLHAMAEAHDEYDEFQLELLNDAAKMILAAQMVAVKAITWNL